MNRSVRARFGRIWLTPLLVLGLVSAMATMRPPAPVPAASPVGYVTPSRIFAETNEGKAGVARVQTLQQQRQGEMRTKQQALEATRKQMAEAAYPLLRLQLQQQEQQQASDLERLALQSQSDVLALRRQVEADVQAKVKKALDELVKGRNVAVVLNADTSIVWGAPSVDFTDAVIQRLNAKPPEK